MHFSIINQLIHQTKLLFFLHPIRINLNNQTIVQPKYDIIIYTIYSTPSDQTLITVVVQCQS